MAQYKEEGKHVATDYNHTSDDW